SDLLAWAGMEQQGEAMTLMIHHLHAMGPGGALPMLEVPRHEITVSPNVAHKLQLAYNREALRICSDD
ncbi:hypothetical protein, partial [Pseudomonas viridiflava]|uniref:hypothetical protein n=1 Tax=Pseudomonas viridiflava TaxID=33069 RepID=UPI000F08E375